MTIHTARRALRLLGEFVLFGAAMAVLIAGLLVLNALTPSIAPLA